MAVVTEPPWVNVGSGVAPRNGTTSHTIDFGFTSTTTNFLIFVVAGSVTNTVTGWTERLQPVSSAELSVFTKTSAAESSITVTHNGSDYPVNWICYEFYTGTTWVNGSSSDSSGDADTFTALTGLPGSAVVVFGGRCRGVNGGTSASSTWTAPWVEDYDTFTADGVTDGVYLTVGRQNNVTATSITPSASSTYGGSWGVQDRQHVSFAVEATVAPSVRVRPRLVGQAVQRAAHW